MNNTFNIKRIGLILKTDWIEHKKSFLLTIALLLIGYLLLMWNGSIHTHRNLFMLGVVFTIISYFGYVGLKIHLLRGRWLTLPASTLEKYTVLLIVGLLYIGIFIFVFWFSTQVAFRLNDRPIVHLFGMESSNVSIDGFRFPLAMRTLALIIFHFAYFFLAQVSFRKYALVVAMAVEAIVVGLYSYLKMYLFTNIFSTGDVTIPYIAVENPLYFLVDHMNTILYVFSILLFYAAYVRLKKMQIR
ncbi:hypothetical protein M2137_002355 [Parabacteroides sp. PFB2-10]|uniref:hypothetical protein n=1 Tax=Parabacteroides sp. PFB2-10 TaxID=1742405 RepID=UPI0024736E53|nr:hypothetical protein [Parabacteroides sp. PFB2-10]MDH6313565.1 hypothetical protein [Parabacteroides sp. PFB2-10]